MRRVQNTKHGQAFFGSSFVSMRPCLPALQGLAFSWKGRNGAFWPFEEWFTKFKNLVCIWEQDDLPLGTSSHASFYWLGSVWLWQARADYSMLCKTSRPVAVLLAIVHPVEIAVSRLSGSLQLPTWTARCPLQGHGGNRVQWGSRILGAAGFLEGAASL